MAKKTTATTEPGDFPMAQERTIRCGKLEIVAENAESGDGLRPLEWHRENGRLVARSVAYGSTEGGLFWRVHGVGTYWSLGTSDAELLDGVPKMSRGGWHSAADAQLVCQRFENKYAEAEGAENAEAKR